MFKIEDKKEILNVFKKISMKELKEYMNKYICVGLEVGNKYNYGGKGSIHRLLKDNISCGIKELCIKYGIEEEMFFDIFRICTWNFSLCLEYKEISVWCNIGKYYFGQKTRKNASYNNSNFTLMNKPMCLYYDIEDENITLYDYIIVLLEDKKKEVIGKYESEIASFQRELKNKKKQLKDIQNINLGNI